MDAHAREIVRETSRASDEHRITFPEVLAALAGAGIERNAVDLVRATSIYYTPDGQSEVVALRRAERPARTFSAAEVAAAVARSQAGNTPFPAFCEEIAEAGCVGYFVSLVGRRVVYYGRTGDAHVEHFPDGA